MEERVVSRDQQICKTKSQLDTDKEYLIEFGYLPDENLTEYVVPNTKFISEDKLPEEFISGLEWFQRQNGLIVTGRLDAETTEAMKLPRCGKHEQRMSYNLGAKWKKDTLTYKIINTTALIPEKTVREEANSILSKKNTVSTIYPIKEDNNNPLNITLPPSNPLQYTPPSNPLNITLFKYTPSFPVALLSPNIPPPSQHPPALHPAPSHKPPPSHYRPLSPSIPPPLHHDRLPPNISLHYPPPSIHPHSHYHPPLSQYPPSLPIFPSLSQAGFLPGTEGELLHLFPLTWTARQTLNTQAAVPRKERELFA
ncbi:matrix metallo ase-18-like [Pelobates cultripes]|uniref:Matrix metallo ase-18-like n=1 Tax=Pelobates cultripes TaxID=61616 RepID=A0AAD1WJV9_PELCU|nr:matrix metallo ase-18-like [Pelobates cultripes]